MDLDSHQLEWVTEHLGHSMQIHKLHYRQTSTIIERAQIAKLLLLQDSGRTEELRNKRLEDVSFSGEILMPIYLFVG